MLDSNTILGIRAYLDCEEFEHGLLTQNIDAWPCGTPVVYAAGALSRAPHYGRVVSTMVYVLMPPCQSAGEVETAQVNIQSISPIGLKPLYKNHKVLTVSRFDIGKFGRLLEFTRDVGGVSLVVEYEGGRENIVRGITQLEKVFKYCSLFSYISWPNKFLSDENDRFVCILTFLDLPYCVPLFNTRKVDGVGLSFSGATVKASKKYGHLHRTFKADFIYSNYEDNVFFVDGIAINSMRRPHSDTYKELNKFAGQRPEIGKPDKKKGMKKSNRYDCSPGSLFKYVIEPNDTPGNVPPEAEDSIIQGGTTTHYYTNTTDNEFIWNVEETPDQADDEPTNEEVPTGDTEPTLGTEPEEGGN